MRQVLAVTFCALMLAGCAGGYDKSAVPGAAAAMHAASDRCESRRAANELKTFSAFETCVLAAERSFATAVKLMRMDSFEEYAKRMQALAADRDANRITHEQVQFDAGAIRRDFLADCGCMPKPKHSWNNDYSPGLFGNPGSGVDMGMGQGNHAMGPGPLNF